MRLALVLALLSLARPASAEPLRYNLYIDVPLTSLALTGMLGSELLLKDRLAPHECHWCEPPGLDAGARSALLWGRQDIAHLLSNLGAFVAVPVVALGGVTLAAGRQNELSRLGPDILVVAEATTLAMDLNQVTKFNVGRERPFVHALAEADKPHTEKPDDNNLSFYSGHTNFTFALATAAGTVAWMHHSPLAPAIWGVGLSLAALTGYLRIAADKHYLTDVLTGAVLGSALGFGLPYALHRP